MQYELTESANLSTAQCAVLKRSVGKTLGDAGRAIGAFYAVKPANILPWQEERFFAVLCMACIWKPEERGRILPLEECLQRIRTTEGLDRRVTALMDIAWSDEDGLLNVKLSRLIRQIHSASSAISPDFLLLYQDLLHWDYDSRLVQKRWARVYFNQNTKQLNENNNVEEEI